MQDNINQLISIAEAAQILGISMTTLRKWDKEGKLKSIRLSPAAPRKYSQEAIAKFIESRQGK